MFFVVLRAFCQTPSPPTFGSILKAPPPSLNFGHFCLTAAFEARAFPFSASLNFPCSLAFSDRLEITGN